MFFLLCGVQQAMALQTANAQDYRDIVSHIYMKNAAEKSIAVKRESLKQPGADRVALERDIAALNEKRKSAAEQALWLTIRAYDIIPFADNIPILDTGKSVLASPERGKDLSWLPIFDEAGPQPDQKWNQKPGDKPGIRVISPRIAGNTASDGISRIFPGTFSSPEELASIIIHEKRHFIQNTTPGKSDIKTTAELEVEAYEEELGLMDILGFAGERRQLQEQRLTEILDGKKGEKGKKDEIGMRKLAEKQRSAANRFNGGLPAPERSLLSHPEEEIKRLVQEAKKQIAIAQRAHDDRLRDAVIALSHRSCANPGSVSGAELLALPRAHFVFYWTTGGPQSCFDEYKYIAEGGTDALALSAISTPPPNAQRPPPSVVPAPVRPIVLHAFSSIYPQLRDFAVAACRDIKRVPNIHLLYGKYIFYNTRADQDLARNLMAGLDDCAQQIFYKAIAKTGAANGYFFLSSVWVAAIVAAHPPQPRQNPGQVAPPSGGTPPGGGGPPPDRRHPDIVIPKLPWEKNIVDIKKTKHEN